MAEVNGLQQIGWLTGYSGTDWSKTCGKPNLIQLLFHSDCFRERLTMLALRQAIQCHAARVGEMRRLVPSSIFSNTQSFSSAATDFFSSIQTMTDDELADTATIPGWEFVHSPPREYPRGSLVGKVVSDKMDKTVNIAVDRYRIHPKYHKRMKYTRKFMAHDEKEVANMGDVVMIVPCHKISKHKHFMLREIIRSCGQL